MGALNDMQARHVCWTQDTLSYTTYFRPFAKVVANGFSVTPGAYVSRRSRGESSATRKLADQRD